MTEQLALSYLNCSIHDDWEDAMDERLFAIKQHFISKPLLFKTAQPKLKLLRELSLVWQVLSSNEQKVEQPQIQILEHNTDDVLYWWSAYSAFQSQWKFLVSTATLPQTLIQLVEMGLQLEASLLNTFPAYNWIDQTPIIGTAPDSMLIQNQLVMAKQKGWNRFEDLFEHKNDLSTELLLALKRLSLLHRYMIE